MFQSKIFSSKKIKLGLVLILMGSIFSSCSSGDSSTNSGSSASRVTARTLKLGLSLLYDNPNFQSGIYNAVKYVAGTKENNFEPIQYDVDVIKITYPVTYPSTSSGVIDVNRIASDDRGRTYMQSARVFIPRVPAGANLPEPTFPTILKFHGTQFSDLESPSNCDPLVSNVCEGLLDATNGFIVIMPDYLGFGESRDAVPLHPSFIPEYYVFDARVALDTFRNLIRTTNIAQQKLDAVGNPYLFLAGYSEGGYAALATQRYFESLGDVNYKITASAPGATPIDLNLTARRLFGSEYFAAPPFIANVYFAYKRNYNYSFSNNDIFKSGRNISSPTADVNYGDAVYPAISSRTNNLNQLNVIISNPMDWVGLSGLSFATIPKNRDGTGGQFVRMSSIVTDNFRNLWVTATHSADRPIPSILHTGDFASFLMALDGGSIYPPRTSPVTDNAFFGMYEHFSDNSLISSKWPSVSGTPTTVDIKTPTRLYHCQLDTIIASTNTATLLAPNLTVVTRDNVTNVPTGALEPMEAGTSTSNPAAHSNHSFCPLISAAVPWFRTYVR